MTMNHEELMWHLCSVGNKVSDAVTTALGKLFLAPDVTAFTIAAFYYNVMTFHFHFPLSPY